MEIGINPESWGREQLGAPQARLDWQGLRARFAAGHAMRHEMDGKVLEKKAKSCSFDSEAARAMNVYGTTQEPGLTPVNPTALDDGKAQGGKNMPVDGNKRPVIED